MTVHATSMHTEGRSVMPSLSDLTRDAVNLVNITHYSEVSEFFFLFETVEEVDGDGDGVCDSEWHGKCESNTVMLCKSNGEDPV